MKLPTIDQIENGKVVILRLDLDLPISDGKIWDNSRLIKSIPTIRLLLGKNSKLIIIGHCGRPTFTEGDDGMAILETEVKEKLSLKPIYVELMSLLEDGEDSIASIFVDDVTNKALIEDALEENQVVFLENLRFYRQETEGDVNFLKHLSEIGDVFVNDALAVAHRKSASVLLYQLMKTYYGLGFAEEIEKMGDLLLNPKRPMILVLGGAKEDKLDSLDILANQVDKILVGGMLPVFYEKYKNLSNVIWANLDESGMDITQESVQIFIDEIQKAGTVLLAGTMGKYEEIEHRNGSLSVAQAIVNSQAIKVGAGGDTKASLTTMGLDGRFDYICSGGGVALDFLAKGGRLPAWENG